VTAVVTYHEPAIADSEAVPVAASVEPTVQRVARPTSSELLSLRPGAVGGPAAPADPALSADERLPLRLINGYRACQSLPRLQPAQPLFDHARTWANYHASDKMQPRPPEQLVGWTVPCRVYFSSGAGSVHAAFEDYGMVHPHRDP